MAHEELEQLELPQRERHGLAVDGDLVGVEVDAQPPAVEDLVWRWDVVAVRAPQDQLGGKAEMRSP